jgi:hypothetical protein
MAHDKTIFGPFGDQAEFDATTVDEPIMAPAGGPATTQRWAQQQAADQRATATIPTPKPQLSYEDAPGAAVTFHEGSLDAALSMLSDDIVDSTSVNLQISSLDSGMGDELTMPNMPKPAAEFLSSGAARGSGVEHKTIRMSAGHPLNKQFPELAPTSLNRSGPLRAPRGDRVPRSPGARGSQVGPQMGSRESSQPDPRESSRVSQRPDPRESSRVSQRPDPRESQPAPIRVDRKGSQPVHINRQSSQAVRINRQSSQPVQDNAAAPQGSLAQIHSDNADPALKKGSRLGNYEIIRKIGQGGMGVVYEARHLLLPRRVAIKFLLVNNAHDEDQIRRFLGEAVASSQIDHRGVVDIYDYGYDERNHAYLVMEYVDGRSLQAVLKRSGQLPLSAALRIARDVAEILGAAHKSGIVHRDLKPDNILLSRNENGIDYTKILDFGVAKFVDEQNMTGKTKIGSIIGTPWYMPPEQCQGFSTVDARSDVYALGCVFFQMVCGKVPFAGSLRDVLMAQVHVAPPPPHNFCPDIPPEVEALILRMMAKEPADRPSSMDEVAATLSAFADPAPARDKANRRPDELVGRRRQNRWVAPVLAALVAGLATSAVFYFLGI